MSRIDRLEAWERGIGRIIREHRSRRGWSQQELAERMVAQGFGSILQTTIAKIEAGTRPLRLSEFVGVAHALDMPWQSLLAEQEPMLDARDPLADMERRVAGVQQLEDEALNDLREGIERLSVEYASLRADRTAMAGEYRRLGESAGTSVQSIRTYASDREGAGNGTTADTDQ